MIDNEAKPIDDISEYKAPDGHVWVRCRWHSDLTASLPILTLRGASYVLKSKSAKIYDWSATSDHVSVVVNMDNGSDFVTGKFSCFKYNEKTTLSRDWIMHFGGPCPFDEDSCKVEVMFRSGETGEGLARNFNWRQETSPFDIIGVRFVRLVEGVEFYAI